MFSGSLPNSAAIDSSVSPAFTMYWVLPLTAVPSSITDLIVVTPSSSDLSMVTFVEVSSPVSFTVTRKSALVALW